MSRRTRFVIVGALLALMLALAGGTALRESMTVDEVSHVGSGLSYLQRFELRLNEEHPPLAKAIAAVPLVVTGKRADYDSPAWKIAADFFPAYEAQWLFGDSVLGRWNTWKPTLMLARAPMLLLTLLLGWFTYRYAARIGGHWGGLLCLLVYVTTPAFLVFGPLVLTDLPVTLSMVLALWQLGDLWVAPTRRNSLFFGLAFGAALLSKFTGLLILPVVLALFIHSRFWPTAGEPAHKEERKAWRRARWMAVLRGCFWAVLCVYVVYLILSWNQSDEALNRIGGGPWSWIIRRPLMPLWLYVRGILLTLLMGSRSTYLFGQILPHGVPQYFPIVLAIKSTPGFLILLVMAAVLGIVCWRRGISVIADRVRPHWRVLTLGFCVLFVVCILSRLDISIRHFMTPLALLIILLAPLPRMVMALPHPRVLHSVTAVAALACVIPVLLAYPYLLPFANGLTVGHSLYYLLNDSNVSWNEALPEVERFAVQQNLRDLPLDWASLSDATIVVPQARIWDCQAPASSEANHWVVVAAVSILENRNCGYLQQYPSRILGGGSFYAFHLPDPIPLAGTRGGPPAPRDRRMMWGMPIDLRAFSVNLERHPEQTEAQMQIMMKSFQQRSNQQRSTGQ